MSRRFKIAHVNDLPEGKAMACDVDSVRIAIFHVGGAYYAIDDTCPHSGAPLCEGEVADGQVTCPWHGAAFDLKTGAVRSPPAYEGVRTYPVTIEGDEICVHI